MKAFFRFYFTVQLSKTYAFYIFFSDTQEDASKLAAFLPIDYVRAKASRITNGVQSLICNEIASIKSKIRTASSVTDAIQNYFTNRKRSLWLWVEDRSLLNRLGFIFRTNLRKTCSCSDITSKKQQQQQDEDDCTEPLEHNCESFNSEEEVLDRINDGIHRYYHVFQKGELTRLIRENLTGFKVSQEWFEQGNWVVIAEKV